VVEKEIPPTYPELVAHMEKVIEERLDASTVARDSLALTRTPPPPARLSRVMRPLWRVVANPIGRVQYFVVIGTVPESARRKLGIEWTATDEAMLRAFGKFVAHIVPPLPERLRYFPIAYRARWLERDRE
jgi:uncharacterized protein (DUF2236 family)